MKLAVLFIFAQSSYFDRFMGYYNENESFLFDASPISEAQMSSLQVQLLEDGIVDENNSDGINLASN
jgi:hypothetical protein